MTIKTIRFPTTGEFKSFQSKFIGYLYPTKTLSEYKEYLSLLKKEHPKATHICYAYRIGFEQEEIRANDDGEPSGSAGKPILNQLYSAQIQNVSLFVVRYYGGTKLGIPGLIEAYKEAAVSCIQQAQIIEEEESLVKEIQLSTSKYYTMIKILKMNKIDILDTSFELDIYTLKILIPRSKMYILEEVDD